MTKLIGFGRCFGKTTMAILESHVTGNQIICANNRSISNRIYCCHHWYHSYQHC